MATAPMLQDEFEEETLTDEERQQRILDAASSIIDRLQRLAKEQVRLKAPIERRWMEDLRSYHGRYDEMTENALVQDGKDGRKRSAAFVKIARAKTRAWRARIADMLFPSDENNWGILPTPVPELTHQAEQATIIAERRAEQMVDAEAAGDAEQVGALGQQKAQADEIVDKVNTIMEEARKRAQAMESEIRDQLVEAKYGRSCRDIIGDMCKLGSGVLKGPITSQKVQRRWTQQPDPHSGAVVYQLDRRPDPRPDARRVDPWAFFPDMSATSMDDCEFTFERHLPSRKEIKRMARDLGFNREAVRRLIENGPGIGSDENLLYLTQLRDLTGEGQALSGRYVMWEYHGPLEVEEICTLMRASGGSDEEINDYRENRDPLAECMVTLFFCGSELLKVNEEYPLDSGDSLYSVVAFDKGEASILGGIGVPRIAEDSVRAINGAWRMMLDNAALSVGPQIVVDKRVIQPADNVWDLAPLKIWERTGNDIAPNQPGFQAINIPMNQQQLAGIIELAMRFVDDETSLPLIAQGEQGSHITQTANGMAILFNAANVVFREVVKNWDDDLTTPTIRRFYDWNMQFNPKEQIKGDMNIDARGTSILLVKELQAQNMMLIAQNWTVHPVLALMLKSQGYHAARKTIQSMNLDPNEVLGTEEEFAAAVKKAAENSQNEQSPEVLAAQIRMQTAEIDGQVKLQIADMQRQTEMMKIAQQYNLGIDQIRAMLTTKKMETNSAERRLAVEAAVEAQQQREAAATGVEYRGSGGYIS